MAAATVFLDGSAAVAATVLTAILLGAGYGILLVPGLVIVEELAPPHELAQTVAVFYCLIYLGFAVPFVIALVAPSIGFVTCFATAAVLLLIALLPGRTDSFRKSTFADVGQG